jgi:Alternative complex III, ActD subunit
MVAVPESVHLGETEYITPRPYALVAEFDTATQLLRAARRAHAAGYRAMDAYAPFPIEGLSDAIGFRSRAIPLIALFGGMLGAATGYGLQYFVHVLSLPVNVGGRPLNSWPAFIPPTFELGVLFAALGMFFGLLILNGHPEPYHPIFNLEAFARASRDRFFLSIEVGDPLFHVDSTRQFLLSLGAREVSDVVA